MSNFYFTFGTDPDFPFGPDDYVLIQCSDIGDAVRLFKALHPNRPKTNCLNCAFFYNEAQWQTGTKKYYEGRDPAETITVSRTGSQ